jgi:hypothetical protein
MGVALAVAVPVPEGLARVADSAREHPATTTIAPTASAPARQLTA